MGSCQKSIRPGAEPHRANAIMTAPHAGISVGRVSILSADRAGFAYAAASGRSRSIDSVVSSIAFCSRSLRNGSFISSSRACA